MAFLQSKIKNTRDLIMLNKGAGVAVVNREILAKTAGGLVIPATNATQRSEIEGVCNQDISIADALTQVPAIVVFSGDTWIGDTTNNTDPADNYQRMILTDSLTVNNTGVDDPNGVVEQVEPYGEAADRKAIFKFV